MLNQQIVLASRPHGMPRPENFRLIETPTPELEDGQVLIQHNWLGMAPAARLRMSEVASYREPMAIGEVPYGQAVGVVAESRSQAIRVGETVMYTSGGWQEYSVAAAHELIKVDPDLAPPSAWLGPLGTSGFTAYLGLIEIGQARSGETVVVSAASGGVGSMAGQIARELGCRVVGIAGGEQKRQHLTDTLGFDAGIDYKAADFRDMLQQVCPEGVDVYFDNVGGDVRDALWPHMKVGGRVVVCGLISEYNDERKPGPGWMSILNKRLTVRGFITGDHLDIRSNFERDMSAWYRNGKINVLEDVREGLDAVIPAFIDMLSGRSLGKTLVRL